jgi:hypothetical protein
LVILDMLEVIFHILRQLMSVMIEAPFLVVVCEQLAF